MDGLSRLQKYMIVTTSMKITKQGDDGTLHLVNVGSTTTLCGRTWTQRRPFMPLALFGAEGHRWCPHCAAYLESNCGERPPQSGPWRYHGSLRAELNLP